MRDSLLRFQPDRILDALRRCEVRYVLIGGLAGVLQGQEYPTFDVDICPEREQSNLDRLALALRELDARIRTDSVPEGLKFDISAAYFRNVEICNMVTSYGELYVTFIPSGTEGYEQLVRHAEVYEIRGIHLNVASLEDIIRSKETADRDKDNLTLPHLRELLARKRKAGQP